VKRLQQFWNEQYRVDRPLEADSWVRSLVQRHVVAAVMNRFPRATTRLLSRSRGELAHLLFVERERGSFRVLRAIYEYENGGDRGDLFNRLLMESPAIKAARNRRAIAQRMLETCLEPRRPGPPALVLAIGGGDGSLELEVIRRVGRRDVYYCALDKDDRAIDENRRVLKAHGLEDKGFVFTGDVSAGTDMEAVLQSASRRFGVQFDGVDITVCHGIAEYLDIDSDANDTLAHMLRAIYRSTRPGGALVISQTDHHDRERWSERALSWYMRLRGKEELAAEVEKAGWQISVCEHEPMRLITMCLAVRPDGQRLQVDRRSELRQPHVPSPVQTPAGRPRVRP
jgi:SAM-dependent methyltransferase